MLHWTTDRIRRSFLDFFKERGHKIVPSASLIPRGDPTLLFTNAGMVPFKDYFLGVRTPADGRVADCQKCLRISGKHNDLETVGRDSYHHTFFEMLGNWSFGDYYKDEAIKFHWELTTGAWKIPPERLWATVYKDDDEAEQAWLAGKYLPRERVLRFGEKDNFWEMGETGPCGPCSEIHIDRGAEASKFCTHPAQKCGVNVDGCARFIELANLVFIQYDRDASGKLTPLPMKCVDTGTGLERVAAVLQSIETGKLLGNYDIDLFQGIIKAAEAALATLSRERRSYGRDPKSDVSFRAIADHARAIAFLVCDGVQPGNTDREYVLRRLMRRAIRHGHKLGVPAGGGSLSVFLFSVAQAVVDAMGAAYPELHDNRAKIVSVCSAEALGFERTIVRGLELLSEWRERQQMINSRQFPGDVAFQLHDTYGFPLDLTQDILRDDGMTVDVAEFNRLMEEQRERSRTGRVPEKVFVTKVDTTKADAKPVFIGYRRGSAESEVVGFGRSSESGRDELVELVTAETPFYPEGGGQIGDRGVIEAEDGSIFEVTGTLRRNLLIVHIGRLLRGDAREFEFGRRVTLKVDRERRTAAMLNHSATHVLHYALREILGTSVHQAGSLVAPDRLRFDFSHNGPVGDDKLVTIEEEVNARVRENAEVVTDEMAYDEAIRAGALAFFGDKYGDRVRVVRMGDFSIELCGGTHVQHTGEIGFFKLAAESAVGAGVRRIEAFTGQGAIEAVREREQTLERIGERLGARDGQALERLEKTLARERELEKKLRALEQRLVAGAGGALAGEAEQVREFDGIRVVTRKVEGLEQPALREMADRLRQKYGSAVVAIGSDLGDKAALVVAVTADLVGRVNAGKIIREIAPLVGGSGGGRADFAQAGGRDRSKLGEALAAVGEALA